MILLHNFLLKSLADKSEVLRFIKSSNLILSLSFRSFRVTLSKWCSRSMLTLFQMTTTEGWADIARQASFVQLHLQVFVSLFWGDEGSALVCRIFYSLSSCLSLIASSPTKTLCLMSASKDAPEYWQSIHWSCLSFQFDVIFFQGYHLCNSECNDCCHCGEHTGWGSFSDSADSIQLLCKQIWKHKLCRLTRASLSQLRNGDSLGGQILLAEFNDID